jgi:hypothetical protein
MVKRYHVQKARRIIYIYRFMNHPSIVSVNAGVTHIGKALESAEERFLIKWAVA